MNAFANAAAIILAGGKISPMGTPKFLLDFAGEPLISQIVRTLASLITDVVVVTAPAYEMPPLPVRVVRDELPFQGPVGGIVYGIQAAAAELCFVTSCDAPNLNSASIRLLFAALGDSDVAAPFWQDRLQPLQAVYRRSVLPYLKQQLDDGRLRPTLVYDDVKTRIVAEAKLRAIDPEGLSFININTPDEYQTALCRWRSRPVFNSANTASLG